ncbi:hypothetical protein I302_103603 [Kwoniella bestiolae CBS 10118]|uniref:Ricin B lectin domain-containing protein n=1 Tax=Kwoniella bestiolae CBS 10118 TaxID=1296100 RepID=A0A1B9G8Y3_9TREE|nr:hypothetical protein I302_02305 [Kwoniella bestiolae CBS 10118]OCF27463.1 hypothetical protein I302_02305 [Kwoniella bestiolae CBS 10118]
MFYLNSLLPLLVLSASSGLANPLPQSQSQSTTDTLASSTAESPASSTASGYPTSIAAESLTQSTDTSSSSAASSASGSDSGSSVVAVQTGTETSSAASGSQSPADIYSHDTLEGVQLKSDSWKDKCLSPDPREELRAGMPVDLYPCVNVTDPTYNARAWNVVPGAGALVVTGSDFALDAGGVDAGVNSSLVLKKSENCSPLQSWYATNDMRIAITGSGICLTDDRDLDGTGPDTDLGVVLYNCTDQNTDQMFLTINATDQTHVPIRPVRSDYTPGVDLPSTSPNALAAVQTDSNTNVTGTASTASAVYATDSATSATAYPSSAVSVSSVVAVDTDSDTATGTTSQYTSVFISVPTGSATGSATDSATNSATGSATDSATDSATSTQSSISTSESGSESGST